MFALSQLAGDARICGPMELDSLGCFANINGIDERNTGTDSANSSEKERMKYIEERGCSHLMSKIERGVWLKSV